MSGKRGLQRLFVDQRGSGPAIEWLGALVIVIGLAVLAGTIGEKARHRIGGGVADTASLGLLASGSTRNNVAGSRIDSTVLPAPTRAPNSIAPHTTTACADGFIRGALHAFVNGEGEIVGDVFGIRDKDIVDFVWNRPATQVLGDVQRAAPGLLAAAPAVVVGVGSAAVAAVQEDAIGAAGSILSAFVIDPIKTTGQLAVDGWHGSGVLIAAAQSGDCVAFGQTVRRGVNNIPELALNAGDASGVLGTGAALGAAAARSHRLAALAKLASARTIGKLLGKEALTVATHSVDNAARAAAPSLAAVGSAVSMTAHIAAATGKVLTTWSGHEALDGARRALTNAVVATGHVARAVASGDLTSMGRHVWNAGRGATAALGTAVVATKVGGASLTQAAHRVHEQLATLVRNSLPESRMVASERILSADRDALAAAAVCVGRKCRGGLCFVAGTPVLTPQRRVAIETLRVGDRVQTTGAAMSNEKNDVDATWKVVSLEMERRTGGLVHIELLRSPGWITRTRTVLGSTIALALPEMNLDGLARVTGIRAAPHVAEGPGRVVLATFRSEANDVLELRFTNTNEVLEPTARHRLYSLDRDDWIAAGKLRVGERLRAHDGEATLASIRHKPGVHTVYNLEVDTDHSYFVGALGVLSHNNDPYGSEEGWARSFEEAQARWPDVFSASAYAVIRPHWDEALRMVAMGGNDDEFVDLYAAWARRQNELWEQSYHGIKAEFELPPDPYLGFGRPPDRPELPRLRDRIHDRMDMGPTYQDSLEDALLVRWGRLLEERTRAGWEPPGTLEMRELILWTDRPLVDEVAVQRLLHEPEAAAFVEAIKDMRSVDRETARYTYITRTGSAVEAAEASMHYGYVLEPDIIQEVKDDLFIAQSRVAPFLEGDLVGRSLATRTAAVEEAYEIASRSPSLVRWNTPDSVDPESVVELERAFRARIALMADEHRRFTVEDFLLRMDQQSAALVVDASNEASAHQRWTLLVRNGEVHLQPFDAAFHTQPATSPNTDVFARLYEGIVPRRSASSIEPVILDNLCLDESSVRAFVRFMVRYLDEKQFGP